jgi:hypothetical protein
VPPVEISQVAADEDESKLPPPAGGNSRRVNPKADHRRALALLVALAQLAALGHFARMTAIHDLECPHCGGTWSVEAVLDASRISWPAHRWLYFDCPTCQKPSHVELRKSQARIGTVDGAPGPCFMPSSSVEVRGLFATPSEHGIEVRFAGRVWFIEAQK